MKAFLILTEGEPRIVAIPREMAAGSCLAEILSKAGIDRFIAHEVSVDRLRETYGLPFDVVESDVRNGKGLRVLDSNGRHAFSHLRLANLGPGITHGISP
jgi:hypothetical protein